MWRQDLLCSSCFSLSWWNISRGESLASTIIWKVLYLYGDTLVFWKRPKQKSSKRCITFRQWKWCLCVVCVPLWSRTFTLKYFILNRWSLLFCFLYDSPFWFHAFLWCTSKPFFSEKKPHWFMFVMCFLSLYIMQPIINQVISDSVHQKNTRWLSYHWINHFPPVSVLSSLFSRVTLLHEANTSLSLEVRCQPVSVILVSKSKVDLLRICQSDNRNYRHDFKNKKEKTLKRGI